MPPEEVQRIKTCDLKEILSRIQQSHKKYNYFTKNREVENAKKGVAITHLPQELCLKVQGALAVPNKRDEAVEERLYFCPQKQCLANPPHRSNVKYPHFFASETLLSLS